MYFEIPERKRAPKILIFDVENSFLEAAVWGINKQYINKTQILSDWFMLSYSYKWLYDERVYSGVLSSEEALAKNDSRIVGELWSVLNECQIAITYNGNFYDIPKTNTRFILNGFPPPAPYKSIDIFQVISRNFSFTNRSMDYVNYMLQLERKLENEGLELWKKCVAGENESLQNLVTYNRQDVVALQETYLKVRPWIKNHPNIGLWHDSNELVCGFCGSPNITWISSLYPTPTGLYKSFRCDECDGIGRSKENLLSKDKRKSLASNV
jgi:hypothetical protein